MRKNTLPVHLKKRFTLKISKYYRELTSQQRTLPDFLILGVQKGGTTSLFRYLQQHPNIATVYKKEVKYFDCNYSKGLDWYRSHFPFREEMDRSYRVSGEASPNYIFHPQAAERARETLPNARLILLLRDPVARALSHYHGNRRKGREKLSFVEAIESETGRLAGEKEKILADPRYPMFKYLHFSYLSRGVYVEQIRNWFACFPREQMLILRSEDFFENPAAVFQRVSSFLELPDWELKGFQIYNYGSYGSMDPEIEKRLRSYFHPLNQELYDYLGVDFGWEIQ
jgi:hypothetical protein